MPDGSGQSGLRGLDLRPGYDSGDEALRLFYIPALERATSYARSVGYFRSSALSVAARGLAHFVAGGGRMRLLVGTDITPEDRAAMTGAVGVPPVLAERMAEGLATASDIERQRLAVLAWLLAEGRLVVRVAVAVDADGHPVVGGADAPYFHEKIGVLRDADGDGVAFQGSVNETAAGWTQNFESFSVYASWDPDPRHYDFWAARFEDRWAGRVKGFRVYDLPAAVRERLFDYVPSERPPARDPEEPPELGDPAEVARFLIAAPRLVGAERLAEATAGVTLFPHQQQVVERLAAEYPRSWLVADEVGLGKTISAGMALRRLMLAGEVRRALILAPASVCVQWQDELFEKFGLWASRYDRGRYHGVHPDDDELLHPGDNPYAGRDLLIASSHLARRRDHQDLVLDAAPFDLLIVDEAHHARRQGTGDPDRYDPGRLLELLDRLTARNAARAVWLLTATPMQVDPIELRDLLRHVGLAGLLEEWSAFERYYAELGKPDDDVSWTWLARALQQSTRLPLGLTEHAVLDELELEVGVVQRAAIERFGTPGSDPAELLALLDDRGRAALRRWLRQRGPVGQFVTRHTRQTLKDYRAAGLLDEPIADREVVPVPIPFSPAEKQLYADLDGLLDRLLDRHAGSRSAGFVLTVYRRRLTSSWAAIRRTLERRLDREELELDEDLLEEAELLDDDLLGRIDQERAVPLTAEDIAEVQVYLAAIDWVDDSKFDRLRQDLDEARSTDQAAIVFTQYNDTLIALRERLEGMYRSQLATFTGEGGRMFDEHDGWVPVAKQDLVEAIRSRRVTVLLANDAASEGLNLQACSFLVNYDMPWNPMRVEQRIGRIDRIGQLRPVVQIRNYFVPGTIEERVYELLADRIDDFSELLGSLQPILGATEDALQSIFRTPRSERAAAEAQRMQELSDRIDDLRERGIDLGGREDPLRVPEYPPPPVTLEQLRERLVEQLNATPGHADWPVTFEADRASRDRENWIALATYGHPKLVPQLERVLARAPEGPSALVIEDADGEVAAAYRADRTPPAPVTGVDALGELGPPVSTGEARDAAARAAEAARAARLERYRAVLAGRTARREEDIRNRFVRLVHRQIAAECALALEETGEELDPSVVWLDLTGDSDPGWKYAEAFRARLGVAVDQLAPARLARSGAISIAEARRIRRPDTGTELRALMEEWRREFG